MITQADIKRQLPRHLRQFVAEQDYETRYSARDHAVWRFVMGQLVKQLQSSAHPVYFDGLLKTGVSLDAIPSIDDMNVCLARLGWRAIVVDGFIPPQAFMELQSLRVLAIALDMRSVHNIEYTPAPDIIHEAAGHAPIIADVEYSEYLQRFGEVGMKAIYNQYDLDLYEAVRELSIVKESADSSDLAISEAQNRLDDLVSNPGQPSELALLTRLHWWTVEYGLVGSTNDYSIFGAGLLSSLSESLLCMDDHKVEKLALTVDAINTPYDITTQQPQLYVTKSCRHLTQILDEYAQTMCYQTGGATSLQSAIDAGVVTTAKMSSGITLSGQFKHLTTNAIGEVIYMGTKGPSQLAFNGEQLEGHGIDYHATGFSSPVGRICNLMKPLETASAYELQEMRILRGEQTTLNFLSGVTVSGVLKSIYRHHGVNMLMTFEDCTVTGPHDELLFEPAWGVYDMVVGESVDSVYAGSADPANYDVYPAASSSKTGAASNEATEIALYQKVANLTATEQTRQDQTADQIAVEALQQYPNEWLLLVELLPHLHSSEIKQQVLTQLNRLKSGDLAKLIDRALS